MSLTEEGLVFVPGLYSRYVRLETGAVAHYVTAGETGPAVILLHGGLNGSSGTAGWRMMAPFLGANGFRVYCPDMPGFGLCDLRPDHWITDYQIGCVRFLRQFADALNLDRFHLAGNSKGCGDAAAFLITHADRVESFVFIAGNVGDLVELPAELRGARPPFGPFDGTEISMRQMLEYITLNSSRVTEDVVAMRTKAANRNAEPYKAWFSSREAVLGDPDLAQMISTKHRLPHLTIPGLYLYGRQDILARVEYGYLQEEALPNVQFFYPDNCGHQGQTDQPDMFNQVFLEFFLEGRVSRATADWAGVSTNRSELAHLVEQP